MRILKFIACVNLLVMFLHLFQAVLVNGVSTRHNCDVIP